MAEKHLRREVIFEFQPVGNIMRVTAMDTVTLTEIVVQCPVTAGENVFKKSAMMRLEYVLKKKGIIS